MVSPKLTRRNFTMSLGASLLAAPFLHWLQSPAAANNPNVAERLIVFFSPNGTVHRHWRPTGTESNFSFAKNSILEPLAPHQSDILILDGIDFVGANNHEGGMRAMLTGGGGASTQTGGRSLDQYVASQIKSKTRFPSLEFGVQTSAWGGNSQTRMSYSAPGRYVPPNDDPVNVYKRLWGDVASKPGQMSDLVLRRKSVLNVVKDELKELRQRLGQEEAYKLDQHMQAIREVERSIQGPSTCSKPPPIAAISPLKNELFPKVGKLQTDLMVQALACGLTKVASIQWSHTVGPPVFSWLGIKEGHHALSHMPDSNPKGVADFVKAERWFAEQFAYLLQALKNTPDPKGGSLLDTSVVMWCKELGDGRMHTCKGVPFVLAGKGSGWKTGRYLQFKNASHQKLLVSMCHAMGLKNGTFGDPSRSTGALPGLV